MCASVLSYSFQYVVSVCAQFDIVACEIPGVNVVSCRVACLYCRGHVASWLHTQTDMMTQFTIYKDLLQVHILHDPLLNHSHPIATLMVQICLS